MSKVCVVGAVVCVAMLCTSTATAGPELVLQLGHNDKVVAMDVFERQGELLAVTVGADKRVVLWDAMTGGVLRSYALPGDDRPIHIGVAAGGRKAVVLGSYKDYWLLDLNTGKFEPHPTIRRAKSFCVAHDRKRAMISLGKEIRLISLPDGKKLASMALPKAEPHGCAFSRDDKIVATRSFRGYITWHKVDAALEPIDQRSIGAFEVTALASFGNGAVWAVRDRGGMRLWDLKARKWLEKWDTYKFGSGMAEWQKNNPSLMKPEQAAPGFFLNEKVRRYIDDFGDKKVRTTHTLINVSGTGPLYGALSGKDSAATWRVDVDQKVADLRGTPLTTSAVAFLPDGKRMALGTRQGRVQVWDMGGARAGEDWRSYSSPVTAMVFSPDGTYAVAGHKNGDVVVRLTKEGRVDRRLKISGEVQSLSFKDKNTLFIQSKSGRQLVKVDSGFEMPVPDTLKNVQHISATADGKRALLMLNYKLTYEQDGARTPLPGKWKNVTFSIMPDGREALIVDGKGVVSRMALPSGKVVGTLDSGGVAIERISISADGKRIAGVGSDGTVRFWLKGKAKPALNFFVDVDGEWVAWTPRGAFDASGRGSRYVAWRMGDKVFELDRFREKLLVPGLARFVLGKGGAAVGQVGAAWSPPPKVRIVSPAPYASTLDASADVVVEAQDAGGGIAAVRLYHQGRLVGEKTGVGGQKTVRASFKVALQAGHNDFVVAGMNTASIESRTPAVVITREATPANQRMRVLSIGINKYRDQSLRLKHARQDAEDFAKALGEGGKDLFKGGIDTKVMVDEAATAQGIESGFQWLINNTQAEDVAVIFIAGHGEVEGDKYYFIPQELAYTGEGAVAKQGISEDVLKDLIRQVPARRVLVFFDTCKSGQFSEGFGARGFKIKKSLSLLGRTTGVYLVAASTSAQLALEDADLGHGLFTYALLQGLGGAADRDKDRAITIHELIAYTEGEVSRISREKLGREQFPVSSGLGHNFPIAKRR